MTGELESWKGSVLVRMRLLRIERTKGAGVIVLGILFCGACACLAGQVIHVDESASGANDGSSWAGAYRFLQDALAVAVAGDQVHVAGGTYKPDQGGGRVRGDRYATFELKNGVAVVGGYAGASGPDPNERDIREYESVLSGDLSGDDGPFFAGNSENSYHVVTGSDTDATAVLEGFTVAAGNADGENPSWNYGGGGGMYCRGGSPTVINCIFRGNSGNLAGALQIREGSSPILVNCLISGNVSAIYSGGGIDNYHSGTRLINCTLTGNTAPHTGSAMYNHYCSPELTNCIVWGNVVVWETIPSRRQIAGGNPIVSHSCIQYPEPDDGGVYWGQGNIDDDPLFVDFDGVDNVVGTADDDLRLLPGSPCVDGGDNGAVPGSVSVDLGGGARIVDGTVDIGAYEGPDQGIVLSEQFLAVPEGQTRSFGVRLAKDPLGAVELSVAVASGDSDITIASGAVLIFDSSDYEVAQSVMVAAAEDEDYFNGAALIVISGAGFFDAGVSVLEWDDEAPAVLYVDADAAGRNDGTSWDDAFGDLQDALVVARSVAQVTEVRVAEGLYRPAGPGGDRGAAFELIGGVSIMGGYAGLGGADPDARDTRLYDTVLSGDLSGNDVEVDEPCDLEAEPTRAENSWQVVRAVGITDANAVLDGFTIMGGQANGGGQIANGNEGGGLYISGYSSPTVKSCVFKANWAQEYGGGVSGVGGVSDCVFVGNGARLGGAANGHYSLVNCSFRGNEALVHGGGVNGSGSLSNCTFVDNRAGGRGGGLCYYDGLSYGSDEYAVSSCRFLGNRAGNGGGACITGSSPVIANCLFSGNSAVEDGGGIFGDTYRCEFMLLNCTLSGNSAGGY
ncbi:MAG: hypothetical protein JSU94_07915, partial [Phycisphaerales bacterium]